MASKIALFYCFAIVMQNQAGMETYGLAFQGFYCSPVQTTNYKLSLVSYSEFSDSSDYLMHILLYFDVVCNCTVTM